MKKWFNLVIFMIQNKSHYKFKKKKLKNIYLSITVEGSTTWSCVMRELNQKKLLIIYYYPKILVYNWFRWCIRGLRRLRIYFSRNLSENLADRAELVFLV